MEKFAKYDENYFKDNGIYIITTMGSTPLLELQNTTRTYIEENNKYNYVLDYNYSNDYTINGLLLNYIIVEISKEDQQYINNIEISMTQTNDENEIGMIGDYAATLDVVENFNVNSFTTNHLMKTYIDEDGYLNGESYETNTLISSNDELETFTNNLKKQINEKEEIKNIKEKLTIYDETFFETKNIYIISIPTSTPACTLEKTEKLSTNIENKYDYNLIYDSDITLSLNGFVNVFFIVEVDKEISEEINTINIVFK
jgi:hypothetical protein